METFDFDNDMSENISSDLYFNLIANERLQGEEKLYFKNHLLEMPKCVLKVHNKKLDFVMVKAISKSYTLIVASNALARSCIVTHSNTDWFLIKPSLCETNNILFSRNY